MSTQPYVAFDLEISKLFLEDNPRLDPEDHLGISCAATVTHTGELKLWHNKDMGERMLPEEVQELVGYLHAQHNQGSPIVSWNGMKFDFHVLAVESGFRETCEELAWEHVDLMYVVHCIKGYPLGLEAASKACGTEKGVEGLKQGRYAPYFWAKGDYQLALDYVAQDARCTAAIADTVAEDWGFIWISRRGNPVRFFVPSSLRPSTGFAGLSPEYVSNWPEPDTSWMDSPIPREDFHAWFRD